MFSARFATVNRGLTTFTHVTKGTTSMAQKWVSFEEVKSQVSISDVLAHYGLMQGTEEKTSKHGLELRLRCPFHEDKTPSLSINAETGKFHCFGCHAKGGDIFDFVVPKRGLLPAIGRKAGVRLPCLFKDWFGVEFRSHPPTQATSEQLRQSAPVEDLTPHDRGTGSRHQSTAHSLPLSTLISGIPTSPRIAA